MEYLRSFLGKEVSGLIRLDHSQEDYPYFHSLGIYLQFIGNANGISILTDNSGNEIICSILSQEKFIQEKLDGYGFINYPKKEDYLNTLLGKKSVRIRIGQFSETELKGNGFTIQRGRIQAIIFEFEDNEFLVMSSGDELWMEVDEKFKTEKLGIKDVEWSEPK